ncbi:MAG: adenylate/guanylate cyclase domain-containing protein [Candidatus Ozemobacteraceae bacterium]
MSERSARLFSTLVSGLVLLLLFLAGAAGFSFLVGLDVSLEASRRAECLEEARHLLPLLRQRQKALTLGRERLFAVIHSLAPRERPMSQEIAGKIARRFDREFPQAIEYAVWDGSGSLLLSKRLASTTLDELTLFMRFCILDERNLPYPWELLDKIVSNLFGESLHFSRKENRQTISETSFKKVYGLAFSGLLFPSNHPSSSFREPIDRPGLFFDSPDAPAKPASSKPVNRHVLQPGDTNAKRVASLQLRVNKPHPGSTPAQGSVFAFVPVTALENRQWKFHAIQRQIPNLPVRLESSTLKALKHRALLPPETFASCKRLFESGFSGIATETPDGRIFCLFHPEFSSRLVLYSVWNPASTRTRFSRSPIVQAAGLGVLVALFFAFRLHARRVVRWFPPISEKFILLSLLACVVPTLGLLWMSVTSRDWIQESRRILAYRDLDSRLMIPEISNNFMESTIVSRAKVFFEKCDWTRSFPSDKELRKLLVPLVGVDIQVLFLHHFREGDILCQNAGNEISISRNTPSSNQQIQLLGSLVELMKDGLKFEASASSKKRGGTTPFQIMLESMTLLFGRENLYKMLLQHDTLINYKFASEVTWVYRHSIHDAKGNPTVLFFLIFHRRQLQKKLALELCEAPLHGRPGTPPFVMVSSSQRESLVIMPERASWQPLMGSILTGILEEGGIVKIPMRLYGRIRLTLSRAIRGMDYAATAVQPDPRTSHSQGLSWISLITILYPIGIIGLIVLLFRAFFLHPLKAAKRGIDRMTAGDYNIRLPVVSEDEIGHLCRSFNRMAEGLQEKEYLSRFLSDLAMEATRRSETPPATRLRAAVLFSDIRGFTTLSESKPGEAIVEMLNQHFTRMEEVIEAEGGTIDKFIGDAIMAIFLPIHGRAHPAVRAARAGLAMREELTVFMHERASRGDFTFNIGVGIASGEVLMGILGEATGRHDFTVIGPTVNRAASMEKCSKKGRTTFVVVCSECASELRSGWTLEAIPGENGEDAAFEVLDEHAE